MDTSTFSAALQAVQTVIVVAGAAAQLIRWGRSYRNKKSTKPN